jgi:hypothetical protein
LEIKNVFQQNNQLNQHLSEQQKRIQQQNQTLMNQGTQQHQRGTLPKDVLDDIAEIDNAKKYKNPADAYKTLAYNFPINNAKSAVFYENALQKFELMLSGKAPLNLKNAIYLVENAYYENTLPYQTFEKSIKDRVNLIGLKMKQDKQENTEVAKNIAIYRFLTDTLKINLPQQNNKTITTFPIKYDFEDYRGEKDYRKMFVSKALNTNSGQCHSLPLLYLLLAEEMNTKAWLSFAPNHTFIKFFVNGKMQNYETTNGYLVSDALMMQSGFIRSEALSNKVYLDTLSKKQLIAHCLMDLAMGYQHKYGYNEFSLRCVDLTLKHYPQNITALLTKSNYYGLLLQYVAKQSKEKRLPRANMQDIPQAMAIYQKIQQAKKDLENIGFAEMPEKMYQDWLSNMKKEAQKQQTKTKK